MRSLLVIGHTWPEPNSTAAGKRMLELLKFFHVEGFKICFASTSVKSEFSVIPDELQIRSEKIKLNDASFDGFIKDLKPDVVLFDRFMTEEQFGWRVDRYSPQSLKILDTEDLHFLREARQLAYKKNLKAGELYPTSDLAKREIAAIYRCDLSLIISEAEMKLLVEEFNVPRVLLNYLPFLLEHFSSEEIGRLPPFETRKDFISIGNFLHEPNWNAILYLKEEIWPMIRQNLPGANFNIYGAYPSQKVWSLHNEKEGFLVKGRVEAAEEVMKNSRVLLAPLRFGAGLKGKLIQAMQCGTPNITTTTGAEGIAGDMVWGGRIEDNPEKFSRAAVDLYKDKAGWQEAQKNGFEILNSRFTANRFIESFKRNIEDLQKNLLQHRKANFTGAMLKHHFHRSTYFMSRFIEEKNKKR